MHLKKGFFIIVFVFFVSISGFSQTQDIVNFGGAGIIASYSPSNPTLWNAGILAEFSFYRLGITFGSLTEFYKAENIYSSKQELTEYWTRGFCMEIINGFFWQRGLIDNIALRLGIDIITSISYVYVYNIVPLGVAFTGLVGIKLFPLSKYFLSIDACPGYLMYNSNSGTSIGSFIIPIRISAGINFF